MSDVPFANIPSNLRVPLFFAEVNNSQANTNQQTQRALIVGQMTGAGTVAANVPVISAGPGDGAAKGGVGSMLDAMMQAYTLNDSFGEVWFLPLADDGDADSASGTITFAGTLTAAGVYALYIAGIKVAVAATSGLTATQIATAVTAAIALGYGVGPNGQQLNLPVTAASAAGIVTLTAKNAGLAGNDIDVQFNFQGVAASEVLPAGATATVVAMSGGATNPSLTDGLANLGAQSFDFIVSPYTDSDSIAAFTALLNDQTGRWSWETQVYGHCFMAYRGTFGALTTFGADLNDPHTSCMGFYASPSPVWAWAAALAGAAAVALRADPARPLQTLPILGVWAPPLADQFSLGQRNSLLYDGIATFTAQAAQVAIENLITTYQLNGLGQADDSYLEANTPFTNAAVLRALAGAVTSNFARAKLVGNGTPIAPNSGTVTPNIIRAFLIATYYQLQTQGLVQNAAFFAANLVVQQNATNPNRVDVLFPAVLVDQLRIFAVLFQFRLTAPAVATGAGATGALV